MVEGPKKAWAQMTHRPRNLFERDQSLASSVGHPFYSDNLPRLTGY